MGKEVIFLFFSAPGQMADEIHRPELGFGGRPCLTLKMEKSLGIGLLGWIERRIPLVDPVFETTTLIRPYRGGCPRW